VIVGCGLLLFTFNKAKLHLSCSSCVCRAETAREEREKSLFLYNNNCTGSPRLLLKPRHASSQLCEQTLVRTSSAGEKALVGTTCCAQQRRRTPNSLSTLRARATGATTRTEDRASQKGGEYVVTFPTQTQSPGSLGKTQTWADPRSCGSEAASIQLISR